MEFFLIYLYIVLSNMAESLFEPLLGVLIIGGFSYCIGQLFVIATVRAGSMNTEVEAKVSQMFKCAERVLIASVVSIALLSTVPSKQDIAWIIGGGVAYNIATTEEAKELPDNVLRALNNFLEEMGDEDPE